MHEVLEGTRAISLFAMLLEPNLNRRRLLGFHVLVPMVMDAERGDEQVNLLKKPLAGELLPIILAQPGESLRVCLSNALRQHGEFGSPQAHLLKALEPSTCKLGLVVLRAIA